MFVHNAWYVGAWSHEVTSGKPFGRTLLDEPLVFFREPDGTARALEDRCCHRGLPLTLGRMVEGRLQCGYHGLEYDGTGRCVRIPGQRVIPKAARVRRFPLVEKNDLLWVWMGDEERADSALIVDFPWHDGEDGWQYRPEYERVACPDRMFYDNLLDLSHVGYVHGKTLGGDRDDHSAARIESRKTGDHLRVTRLMRDTQPGPFHIRYGGFEGSVDRYQIMEFRPGFVLIHSGMTDAGRIDSVDGELRIEDGAFNLAKEGFNGVTPETAGSTHYFFSMAHRYGEGRPDVAASFADDIQRTFLEDVAVLEAQARNIARDPERPLVGIATDGPSVQARGILDRLVAAQAQQAAE